MHRIVAAYAVLLDAFAQEHAILLSEENKSFTPPLSLHLRPKLLPQAPQLVELGDGGMLRHEGRFLIEVVTPAGSGETKALETATALLRHFKRGPVRGFEELTLKPGSSAEAVLKDGRYVLPVSIPYYAYLREE